MRKVILSLILALSFTVQIFALEGEMGYFGGISTGTKLPTTTELAQKDNRKRQTKETLPYKENIYINGKAELVEGTIEIRPSGGVDKEKETGSYKESYIVRAQNEDRTSSLSRSMTLTTEYIYNSVHKQATKTSKVTNWSETVVVDGQTYTLDSRNSFFHKSILEDYTPGVMYYRGDISYSAVYNQGGADNNTPTVVNVSGPIYGYDQPWSKTETQKLNILVDNGERQYHIEQNPSLTVSKSIQYGVNEPNAISFKGNYKELTKNEGMANYNIRVGQPGLYNDEKVGSMSMSDNTSVEQLIIPYVPRVQGHFAESDIKKLYSMGVYTGSPAKFNPNEIITRGDYIEALVLSMKIPIEEISTGRRRPRRNEDEEIIFTDITEENKYYPYAVAAYEAGLIGKGSFNPNSPITREQAYTLIIRMIGLEQLGFYGNIHTPFVDDANISRWAKRQIQAGVAIGIIRPDENGYLIPQRKVTKAEAAAFINQMIDYLRHTLKVDYQEKILM